MIDAFIVKSRATGKDFAGQNSQRVFAILQSRWTRQKFRLALDPPSMWQRNLLHFGFQKRNPDRSFYTCPAQIGFFQLFSSSLKMFVFSVLRCLALIWVYSEIIYREVENVRFLNVVKSSRKKIQMILLMALWCGTCTKITKVQGPNVQLFCLSHKKGLILIIQQLVLSRYNVVFQIVFDGYFLSLPDLVSLFDSQVVIVYSFNKLEALNR